MKKAISVMLAFVIMSLPMFSNLSAVEVEDVPKIDNTQVLSTRFLNMLNHNFVYGNDFEDLEKIVNNSVIALLDYRDSNDDSYIAQDTVNSYLYDMFGFKIDDFSLINEEFGYKEGFVYILPRGFELYEHKAISLSQNEDLTYTFVTDVTIKTHDGCEEDLTATTLFVENPTSAFGFNIVTSTIE